MKTLFESARYLVTAGGDRSLQPVVTFHPRRDMPGIERHRDKPWMRKPIEQAGFRWIAVTTEQNDWYQHNDMDDVVQAINRYLNCVQPLTFGFSMGGLAAWQNSDALNALAWVGVSPTCDTRPSQTFDSRVMGERKSVEDDCGWRQLPPVPKNGHIVFDPKSKLSAFQTFEIAQREKVAIHPYPGSGHACLVTFTKEGRLAERLAFHFNKATQEHADSV